MSLRRIVLCAILLLTAQAPYTPEYSAARPESTPKTFFFGIHPLHNAQRLFEIYQPLMDGLGRAVPNARFKLEASKNYAEFERKLKTRHFDFALPNPYQTLLAQDCGYRVFGKMADDAQFRGIILVRKDGPIHRLEDLRGQSISFPAPTALAATVLPKWFLHQHGINVAADIKSRYVGSQESAIMNVYMGATAAAATWPSPWRAFITNHPDLAGQLKVAWETDSLINNALVARDDEPAALVAAVGASLFGLQNSEQGRAMLKAIEVSRFESADDHAYEIARRFIARFTAELGPIGDPQ